MGRAGMATPSMESAHWMAHIDIFVDPERPESDQEASYAIIQTMLLDKKLSIQDVVSSMGKYLTTTDGSMRARGLMFLGRLLAELHSTPLESTAVQSLAKFLTVKLDDWRCVRGVLIGVTALLKRPREVGAVDRTDVIDIAKSILQNLQVQAMGLADRLLALELYQCLLNQHGATVSSLGAELILGVGEAIDQEKDPRCLLVTFHLVELLCQLFPQADGLLAEHADELFGIVSQYFPVSFNPLPNDTQGITRDDLAVALLKVFTSSPHFVPFCFPLLLEKLSSTLRVAKLDSLKYLGTAALSFGPHLISKHVGAIWAALKHELIPVSDFMTLDPKSDELRREALVCLRECVKGSIRTVEGHENTAGSGLLTLVCDDECVEDLVRYLESNSSSKDEQIQATGEVLGASMKASPTACYMCTTNLLDRIVSASEARPLEVVDPGPNGNGVTDESQLRGQPHPNAAGLRVILQILNAASTVAEEIASRTDPGMSMDRSWLQPISFVAPRLILAYNQVALGRAQAVKLRVAGLQSLASFPTALSPLSKEGLIDVLLQLVETLLDSREPLDVHNRALEAFLAISNTEEQFGSKESPVLRTVIPKLLEAVTEVQTLEHLNHALNALVAIAGPRLTARKMVLNGLSPAIMADFENALSPLGASESPKMVTILRSLSYQVIPMCERDGPDQMAACDIIIGIWSAIQSRPLCNPEMLDSVLSAIMEFNRVVIRTCSAQVQERILSMTTDALLASQRHSGQQENVSWERETSDVEMSSDLELSSDVEMSSSYPATELTNQDDTLTCAFVASVVTGLLPSVLSPRRSLLLKMIASTSSSSGRLRADAIAQARASILNKWTDSARGDGAKDGEAEGLDIAIRYVVEDRLMPVLNQYLACNFGDDAKNESHSCDKEATVRAVHELAWVGKGLAMRGHSRVPVIAAAFLDLLQVERSRPSSGSEKSGDQTDKQRGSSAISQAAAESIGMIVRDHSPGLDKVHNAVIRPHYEQWFFKSMLPPLQEALRTAGNLPYRIWFVRASLYLISGMPPADLLTEGRKIFPMILDGLSVLSDYPSDSKLLLAAVLSLALFLTDDNSGRIIAADFVPAVTKRLIKLTQYRHSSLTRQTALQCLAAIIGMPFARVYPEKIQVLKAVTAALDDRKRSVRKEAVRCRKVWLSIS